MNPVKTSTILYVDDDPDDVELLEYAFSLLDASYILLSAPNGEEGLKALNALKESGSLPCLIVLDINMPRLDGRETFQRLKENPSFATIPVVIFSTSDSEKDKACFKTAGVEYVTKPICFDLFLEAAKRLLHYCQN